MSFCNKTNTAVLSSQNDERTVVFVFDRFLVSGIPRGIIDMGTMKILLQQPVIFWKQNSRGIGCFCDEWESPPLFDLSE